MRGEKLHNLWHEENPHTLYDHKREATLIVHFSGTSKAPTGSSQPRRMILLYPILNIIPDIPTRIGKNMKDQVVQSNRRNQKSSYTPTRPNDSPSKCECSIKKAQR